MNEMKVIDRNDWVCVEVRSSSLQDGKIAYSRHVVLPDSDLNNEESDVRALCEPLFTDAVKAAYQAHLSSQE